MSLRSEQIGQLDNRMLQAYLRRQGWTAVKQRRSDLALYRHPEGEYTEILIPLDDTLVD